jgi:ankyrin repeat protein
MNRINQELIVAAGENNLPEVRRLVSVGADVNAKNAAGWTSLHYAIFNGHLQVVKELLEHGADIEVKASEDWTPLHWSCDRGRLAVVIDLLGHGASIDTSNERKGATNTSFLGKRKSRVGADVDAKDDAGSTPLHIASFYNNLPVVKALLSAGADILAARNDGKLPIHFAVSEGKSEVSKYLLREFYAAFHRLPLHELVEDLTWIGNPDGRDAPPLRTALHKNVLGTDDVVEILEYLVGQNPELLGSRDPDGSLPLHVACRRGACFSIVQSLVNLYKASVRSVTPQGDLPLFLACEMPETSLDAIFLLMKLYPDLVYRSSLENRCGRNCSL